MLDIHGFIGKHLLKRSILSYLLYPVGQLYAAFQAYRRRQLSTKQYHAPCKIISIGNIVSGGSGKTPLTIALVKMLADSGIRVAVSHRGYKGKFENSPRIISNSAKLLYPADVAGDEAYLIASSLPGIPVVVGRRRKDAIRLLLKSYPSTQVVVMDDAFQHIRVARDLDIICFSAESGIGNGFVLPAGYLRESLRALNNNCLAVVYRMQGNSETSSWESKLNTENIFHSHATLRDCVDCHGEHFPFESLHGKRIVLVSGIANPQGFEENIRKLGISFATHHVYPDHHHFADAGLTQTILSDLPDVILCTQKDIMKLAVYPELAPRLRALVLAYQLDDYSTFRKRVLDVINAGK